MVINWFTENYPPNKGGMARSCDRIIANLRQHHTIHIFHFTNKQKPFFTEANVGGSYTAIPLHEDSSHTLNVLWAYLQSDERTQSADCLVSFGSHLCLKGIPLMATWLGKPLLTCFRGNDFDTAIFSQKKQNLLYAIEKSAAIACVTKEKCERIRSMNLNENIFFTPNSIQSENWEILDADRILSEKIKQELPTEKLVIGLIGYLKPKKGIEFFVQNLIRSELANSVQLRIVGEMDLPIESEIIKSGIPYSICQPQSQTELMVNYILCDAIAIPSIYDGMPNVIFEAGMLEVPIIASKAGGIVDVLSEEDAFLFENLNDLSLLNMLTDFKNTSEENKIEKSKKLQNKLKTEFSSQMETSSFLKIFEYIVTNKTQTL